ncbi:SMP-30/gluconolactonase/LRE family protein [Mariniflexile sp.]|uniref:SMP-30/gluconolactonase/LRE family protein n=1 Tax=Mariniflexile sp. TaxID=1979402 RepID=UPI004047D3C7
MKNYFMLSLAIFTLLSCGNKKKKEDTTITESAEVKAPKTTLTLLRETTDLPALESVIFDEKRNVLYVSIQADKEPGDGSIATVSLDGELLNLKFTSGLNDPKGMAIVGDKLYVGDLFDLVEIDLETGNILKKYTDKKVRYFNDVTADGAGNVYVTDMHASSIYKLDANKNFTEWYASPNIESANGLLVVGNELIIGGWGYFTDGKALDAGIGKLHKMNLETQELSAITPDALGNLDGVQVLDDNSYIVSDWKEGKVFKVNKDGTSEELLDTERGAADLWYIRDKKLLLLPLNKENKLAFYEVN